MQQFILDVIAPYLVWVAKSPVYIFEVDSRVFGIILSLFLVSMALSIFDVLPRIFTTIFNMAFIYLSLWIASVFLVTSIYVGYEYTPILSLITTTIAGLIAVVIIAVEIFFTAYAFYKNKSYKLALALATDQ